MRRPPPRPRGLARPRPRARAAHRPRQRGRHLRPRLALGRARRRRRGRRGRLLRPTTTTPPALVGARGPSLSIGYVYAWNHLSIERPGQRRRQRPRPRRRPGAARAPSSASPSRSASASTCPTRASRASRRSARRRRAGRSTTSASSILFLAANLAVRPVPWLEIGGGVAFLAATQGQLRRSAARPTSCTPTTRSSGTRSTPTSPPSATRSSAPASRSPGFGYLAAVYRGETKLELPLDAHLQGSVRLRRPPASRSSTI